MNLAVGRSSSRLVRLMRKTSMAGRYWKVNRMAAAGSRNRYACSASTTRLRAMKPRRRLLVVGVAFTPGRASSAMAALPGGAPSGGGCGLEAGCEVGSGRHGVAPPKGAAAGPPVAAGGARGSGAVSARIRALLGSLTRAETAVAEVVLDRHNDVVGLSVEALAEQAGVSTATVLRLSQALGFSGFKELKIALAMERGGAQLGPLQEEISPDDPPIQIARKVMQAEIVALTEVSELLDEAELEAAVAALAGARAIEIYGMGSSAPVVMDAYYRSLRLGLRVPTPPDSHMQAVNAARLGPGDVALVISHTGQTKDVVHTARQAREVGATVITLTSYYRTPL